MRLKIGQRFEIIREPGDNEPVVTEDTRLPVVLAAGRAFGSGDHETTTSCLEEMEGLVFSPRFRVLDIGCGTGILSVAAVRLGAEQVVAIDPDAFATQTTQRSLEMNRMQNQILPVQCELAAVKTTGFDLILSNLYGDILVKLAPDIARRIRPGGRVILSGILFEYAFDLKKAFGDDGFHLVRARYMNDYVTLHFLRPQ